MGQGFQARWPLVTASLVFPQQRSQSHPRQIDGYLTVPQIAKMLTGLKQKLSPNEPQTCFISYEYVTIMVKPFDKTIRNGCTKSL